MDIFQRITCFVSSVFKTSLEIFFEALKLSPNAQGYVSGSITELLLKKKLEEEYGFEVKRIREKWEGRKHPSHHGDFYFRAPNTINWFVIESKGLKSNSEKWHKLYNFDKLRNFLIAHKEKISWLEKDKDVNKQITDWIYSNLPKFKDEYQLNLYDYEEVQKYKKNRPKKETAKSREICRLENLTREQINAMIEERLNYVMSKVKVLETHFVSGTSGASERTQATPRKDEFNIISIDIFLRYSEHKFLFANPNHLESSADDPNHLQQNYIIGFVFSNDQEDQVLSLMEEWCENFIDVYESINPEDHINEEDMQIDNRYTIYNESE